MDAIQSYFEGTKDMDTANKSILPKELSAALVKLATKYKDDRLQVSNKTSDDLLHEYKTVDQLENKSSNGKLTYEKLAPKKAPKKPAPKKGEKKKEEDKEEKKKVSKKDVELVMQTFNLKSYISVATAFKNAVMYLLKVYINEAKRCFIGESMSSDDVTKTLSEFSRNFNGLKVAYFIIEYNQRSDTFTSYEKDYLEDISKAIEDLSKDFLKKGTKKINGFKSICEEFAKFLGALVVNFSAYIYIKHATLSVTLMSQMLSVMFLQVNKLEITEQTNIIQTMETYVKIKTPKSTKKNADGDDDEEGSDDDDKPKKGRKKGTKKSKENAESDDEKIDKKISAIGDGDYEDEEAGKSDDD